MDQKKRNQYITVLILVVLAVSIFYFVSSDDDMLTIGITQYVEHPALDAARKGFIDFLSENGYTEDENIKYNYQNAQAEISNAKTIAKKFKRDKPSLILAIATPNAQATANTIKDIPILITAVTNPVGDVGVESLENPNTNISGTNDMPRIDRQLDLLLKLVPDAKDIGTVYNAGEANSVFQLAATKEECEKRDLNLHEATADTSANVLQATKSLIDKVDAIYIFTDNTAVSAIDPIINICNDNDIPLIVADPSSVEKGALAADGISYYELGYQTGAMALKILEEDAKPENMAIETQKDTKLMFNKTAAAEMGVTIPADLLEQADKVYE